MAKKGKTKNKNNNKKVSKKPGKKSAVNDTSNAETEQDLGFNTPPTEQSESENERDDDEAKNKGVQKNLSEESSGNVRDVEESNSLSKREEEDCSDKSFEMIRGNSGNSNASVGAKFLEKLPEDSAAQETKKPEEKMDAKDLDKVNKMLAGKEVITTDESEKSKETSANPVLNNYALIKSDPNLVQENQPVVHFKEKGAIIEKDDEINLTPESTKEIDFETSPVSEALSETLEIIGSIPEDKPETDTKLPNSKSTEEVDRPISMVENYLKVESGDKGEPSGLSDSQTYDLIDELYQTEKVADRESELSKPAQIKEIETYSEVKNYNAIPEKEEKNEATSTSLTNKNAEIQNAFDLNEVVVDKTLIDSSDKMKFGEDTEKGFALSDLPLVQKDKEKDFASLAEEANLTTQNESDSRQLDKEFQTQEEDIFKDNHPIQKRNLGLEADNESQLKSEVEQEVESTAEENESNVNAEKKSSAEVELPKNDLELNLEQSKSEVKNEDTPILNLVDEQEMDAAEPKPKQETQTTKPKAVQNKEADLPDEVSMNSDSNKMDEVHDQTPVKEVLTKGTENEIPTPEMSSVNKYNQSSEVPVHSSDILEKGKPQEEIEVDESGLLSESADLEEHKKVNDLSPPTPFIDSAVEYLTSEAVADSATNVEGINKDTTKIELDSSGQINQSSEEKELKLETEAKRLDIQDESKVEEISLDTHVPSKVKEPIEESVSSSELSTENFGGENDLKEEGVSESNYNLIQLPTEKLENIQPDEPQQDELVDLPASTIPPDYGHLSELYPKESVPEVGEKMEPTTEDATSKTNQDDLEKDATDELSLSKSFEMLDKNEVLDAVSESDKLPISSQPLIETEDADQEIADDLSIQSEDNSDEANHDASILASQGDNSEADLDNSESLKSHLLEQHELDKEAELAAMGGLAINDDAVVKDEIVYLSTLKDFDKADELRPKVPLSGSNEETKPVAQDTTRPTYKSVLEKDFTEELSLSKSFEMVDKPAVAEADSQLDELPTSSQPPKETEETTKENVDETFIQSENVPHQIHLETSSLEKQVESSESNSIGPKPSKSSPVEQHEVEKKTELEAKDELVDLSTSQTFDHLDELYPKPVEIEANKKLVDSHSSLKAPADSETPATQHSSLEMKELVNLATEQESSSILQLQPLKSAFKLEMLHQLNILKLNTLKLQTGPVPFVGIETYSVREGSEPVISFDARSLELNANQLSSGYNLFCPGALTLHNTLEELNMLDRDQVNRQAELELVQAMDSHSVLNQPGSLRKIHLHMFIDMKKFKYYYQLLQPTLKFEDQVKCASDPKREFTTAELNSIAQQCKSLNQLRWEGKRLFDDASGFFLMRATKHQDQKEFEVRLLKDFDAFYQTDKSSYLISLDTSTDASKLSPTTTNLLYYLRQHKNLAQVQLLALRHSSPKNKGYHHLTRTLHLQLPQPKVGVQGWEQWQPKSVYRVLDFGSSMDPKKQAETSVGLNLSLMKWNAEPNIDLEVVANSKCLLLGAGTLGSNVARILMGWNVQQITLVDNGRVTFSNPVRQPLYEFEDCLDGGKPKAVAAAEALKRIYPHCRARGVDLTIPMPGHRIEDFEVEKVAADVHQLEELVQGHDVVFALTDSRESRWLPTLLAKLHGKLMLSVGLGFDGFTVIRHGCFDAKLGASQLGCYFCSDFQVPNTPTSDRTLDQQCTVTRPGLAPIASGLAVELLVSVLQHPLRGLAPPDPPLPPNLSITTAATAPSLAQPEWELNRLANSVPHQLRGFLGQFEFPKLTAQAFPNCVACSPYVTEAYNEGGFRFLQRVLTDSNHLKQVAQIDKLEDFVDFTLDEANDDFDLSGSDEGKGREAGMLKGTVDGFAEESEGAPLEQNLPLAPGTLRSKDLLIEPTPTPAHSADNEPSADPLAFTSVKERTASSLPLPLPFRPVHLVEPQVEGVPQTVATPSTSTWEVQPPTALGKLESTFATAPRLGRGLELAGLGLTGSKPTLINHEAPTSTSTLPIDTATVYIDLSYKHPQTVTPPWTGSSTPSLPLYTPRLKKKVASIHMSSNLEVANPQPNKVDRLVPTGLKRPLEHVNWKKVPTRRFLYPVRQDPFQL